MAHVFFRSGISGLVYQIVWTRLLVLVFGNTLLATSTVVTAFMGELAAGSYAFGLVFPALLSAVTPAYAALYRSLEGNVALVDDPAPVEQMTHPMTERRNRRRGAR